MAFLLVGTDALTGADVAVCVCVWQAPKATVDELSVVSSSCYRLNSLQLRAILSRYRPARDEPAISPDLVESIVKVSDRPAPPMDVQSVGVDQSGTG